MFLNLLKKIYSAEALEQQPEAEIEYPNVPETEKVSDKSGETEKSDLKTSGWAKAVLPPKKTLGDDTLLF